jgi:hypothetical protein
VAALRRANPIGRRRADVKVWLPAFALFASLPEPVMAQQGTGLPPITVRPSGVEDEDAAARERLERLVRRREESAYRFRHICIHCVAGPAGAPAPFYPLRALDPGKPSPE